MNPDKLSAVADQVHAIIEAAAADALRPMNRATSESFGRVNPIFEALVAMASAADEASGSSELDGADAAVEWLMLHRQPSEEDARRQLDMGRRLRAVEAAVPCPQPQPSTQRRTTVRGSGRPRRSGFDPYYDTR